ncbi:hypothetical protein DPMN_062051 [Dreissena polymorpha]|uniref:Uncharacterized protein n=1 Tax=Dreissena polymorpha TaxID=45954 RepID=A0A9D4C941_DREPO|nr:hypothetical protein DPMN_062051 [Dreissena polymorpha]
MSQFALQSFPADSMAAVFLPAAPCVIFISSAPPIMTKGRKAIISSVIFQLYTKPITIPVTTLQKAMRADPSLIPAA